jgi:hypothetical protein
MGTELALPARTTAAIWPAIPALIDNQDRYRVLSPCRHGKTHDHGKHQTVFENRHEDSTEQPIPKPLRAGFCQFVNNICMGNEMVML